MTFTQLKQNRLLVAVLAIAALFAFLHLLEHYAHCDKAVDNCELCHFVISIALVLPAAVALLLVQFGLLSGAPSVDAPSLILSINGPRGPPTV